jgi:hypothetical protein
MMKVKSINWISQLAKEAELIVSDGINECLVFSQPCVLKVGEKIPTPLQALDVEGLMIVIDEGKEEKIQHISESYFAQHCIAKVIDKEEGVVGIGGIRIELGCRIPGWANEDDLIEFNCSRIDIW